MRRREALTGPCAAVHSTCRGEDEEDLPLLVASWICLQHRPGHSASVPEKTEPVVSLGVKRNTLAREPSIRDGIERIVWMGGALQPADWDGSTPYGNIDLGIAPGANPNAEWNAYWDPYAVRDIFASGIPIVMFPLNVTNAVFLGPEQVLMFAPGAPDYPIYDLAGQLYSMVAFEAGYAFWDTVTTAYLGKPELFKFEEKRLSILTEDTQPPTSTSDQGTISEDSAGHSVTVATQVDADAFYDFLLASWRKPPAGF